MTGLKLSSTRYPTDFPLVIFAVKRQSLPIILHWSTIFIKQPNINGRQYPISGNQARWHPPKRNGITLWSSHLNHQPSFSTPWLLRAFVRSIVCFCLSFLLLNPSYFPLCFVSAIISLVLVQCPCLVLFIVTQVEANGFVFNRLLAYYLSVYVKGT